MKKVVTFIMSLLYVVVMTAQTNPQPGYIITNTDGAEDFQKYKPGEISGYRLTNNGIFYVTLLLLRAQRGLGASANIE